MAELIGLPAPPAVGATALPPAPTTTRASSSRARAPGSARRSRPSSRGSGGDRHRQPEGRAPRRRPRGDRGDSGRGCSRCSATSARPDSVAAAFDAAEEAFGLPDVLVNNAAANFPVPAEDMSPNAWRTVVDITLNGTFLCAREFGRRHLVAGTPGSIINVGASYAWTGGPGFVHSAAAKAGVKNLTESLAVEWGPYGIQVNGLVPGLFPHEDMTDDIRGNLDRTDDKDACQPAAGRPAPGARVGRPRSSRRPTRASSPATRSSSTARTGNGGRSRTRRSRRCATRWAGARSTPTPSVERISSLGSPA